MTDVVEKKQLGIKSCEHCTHFKSSDDLTERMTNTIKKLVEHD